MVKNDYTRNIKQPDETRPFKSHGHVDVLKFPDGRKLGQAVFEPGWKWSEDVKPIAGTETCQEAHVGYQISGTMFIQMDNGDEFRIRAGDAYDIPPGHDAWVEGNEKVVDIDMTGFGKYAEKAA